MSPYVTKEEFLKLFPEADKDKADSALTAASIDADSLTFNRITACGFQNLTPFQQERVKYAVCCQADFRLQNEDLFSGSVASYSLNGASVTVDSGRLISQGGALTSCEIFAALSQSGLCRRI